MSQRSGMFVGIGIAGFAVQLCALDLLTAGFGVSPALATAAAVELAVLHNFSWHERWTWADRTAGDPGGARRRLLRFHLSNGTVSLLGNVALTTTMAGALGLPVLLANAIAVAACTAVNFVAADRLVFNRAPEAEA